MLKDVIDKNLLDLEFSKYLQFYNTAIIVLFTYFIGLALALLTRQIDVRNIVQVIIVADISAFFSVLIVMLILSFKRKMRSVLSRIQKL